MVHGDDEDNDYDDRHGPHGDHNNDADYYWDYKSSCCIQKLLGL